MPFCAFGANLKDDCSVHLQGLKQDHFSQFVISPHYPFHDDYSVVEKVVIPQNGIGRLLYVKVSMGELKNLISKWPKFFKQFDIYADAHYTIYPDAVRLNHLMKNGIKFKDVPFYRKQHYSSQYFSKSLEKGFVPLASFGFFFHHDRAEDHLIGALVLPAWLYIRMVEKHKQSSKEDRLKIALQWDRMTSFLGQSIVMAYRYDHSQAVGGLEDALKIYGNAFAPEGAKPLSPEFIHKEAVRILKAVTDSGK